MTTTTSLPTYTASNGTVLLLCNPWEHARKVATLAAGHGQPHDRDVAHAAATELLRGADVWLSHEFVHRESTTLVFHISMKNRTDLEVSVRIMPHNIALDLIATRIDYQMARRFAAAIDAVMEYAQVQVWNAQDVACDYCGDHVIDYQMVDGSVMCADCNTPK